MRIFDIQLLFQGVTEGYSNQYAANKNEHIYNTGTIFLIWWVHGNQESIMALRKRGKNQNNLLQQLNANKQVKSYFCIGNFMLEEIIFTKGE